MRKGLLIGGTLLVLIAVFAAFMWFQRGAVGVVTGGAGALKPATRPAATTQIGSIGRTESAGATTWDKRTGLPQARFSGEQFLPQQGDQILVERPRVDFFLGKTGSEVVRIQGKTGLITMPGEGPRIRSNLKSTPIQAPSRGEMRDVLVSYFPTQQDAANNRPEMTMTLNNAYFDSDAFEIATEDYTDAEGKKISGRDVPVTVRGEAFEFDGKGLLIRWDEQSKRLKSLTVFQGERLTIKRPGRPMNMPSRSMAAPSRPIQLASTDPAMAIMAISELQAADAKFIPAQIYRATFHDGVRVMQRDKLLAQADVMHVDYFVESNGSVKGSTRSAAPIAPKALPLPATTTQAAAENSGGKPTASRAADKQTTPAGVDPEAPIDVYWGGQLTVTPAPEEALMPRSPGDAVVRFAGSASQPVRLFGDGAEVEASSAAYHIDREFAWIEGSQNRPVRMKDAKGSVLLTPQLRYAQKRGIATLRGPSSAVVHTEDRGKPQTLNASWRDLAEVRLVDGKRGRAISSLSLKGDVEVQHPMLQKFHAGVLTLDFDTEHGRSDDAMGQVRRIAASENVVCTIVDESKEPQSIRAQDLQLTMAKDASGANYPARVEASGDVVAGTAKEQISAQRIEADLNPPDRAEAAKKATASNTPEIAGMRNLIASGAVKLQTAEGGVVKGERLQVRQSKEKASWVMLEGAPATVEKEGTVLAGRIIELDTATEKSLIAGGGRVVFSDANLAQGGKGLPVEVSWDGDGRLDGQADVVSVVGNVLVKYTDVDGTLNEAAADRMDISLGRKAPKAAPAATAKREMNFMANRYAKALTMLPSEGKDVRLQSLLPGPGGTILRQMNLYALRLDATFAETGGIERIETPGSAQRPGRLLYVALPAATRKPIATGDPMKTRLDGATAFAWNDKLVYDKTTNAMEMTGGVRVRHKPETPGGKRFEIDADRIVAELATKSAAAHARVRGESAAALDVKRITVSGRPVKLVRDDAELTAPLVEVNPGSGMVYAKRIDNSPVDVLKGRITGTFDLVEINSQTNMMEFKGAQGLGRQ